LKVLTLNKASLALLIHSHQPVGNFDHVIEEAYRKSYAPFLYALAQHPTIRMSLHYSGSLLEWLEAHHPEFFARLQRLVERRQVELVGGGYYEPILPSIPDPDKRAQILKLADYLRQHFGTKPRGAWIAERVWEPSLAKPLAEAHVDYVVLDDTHFIAAGLEPNELHTTYITEEVGAAVRLVPSLKPLRYTIPFQEPEETLKILQEGRGQWGALFAMGDDCEKFGVWPGTYAHCYTNGWLERFLKSLESAKEWLETTILSDHLDTYPPRGRIYLPTGSYPEMMEWALPAAVSRDFRICLEEVERLPSGARYQRYMRGGLWRNFLSRYSESNQLNKFMLDISRRLQAAQAARSGGKKARQALEQAHTHLLAAQCNDAYWHGVFGGLYAPHLRSALLRHLIQAESLVDSLEPAAKNPSPRVESRDFDVDGQPEILLSNSTFGMTVKPADGGTVASLRFKPQAVELVNSLMRRPEAYHDQVRQKAITHEAPREGPASIHDQVWAKEPDLEALLRYDHYARNAFRTLIFPASRRWQDFDYLRLDENGDLAGGEWKVVTSSAEGGNVEMSREACHRVQGVEVCLRATKQLQTVSNDGVWRLSCRTNLATDRPGATPLVLGTELVLNLLAPNAPDRYFLFNGTRRPLEFKGEIEATQLSVVDEWQRVEIRLTAEPQARWWIVPIETISQSETGYERVYQGSAILAVWKTPPPAWREIICTVRAEISTWAGRSNAP